MSDGAAEWAPIDAWALSVTATSVLPFVVVCAVNSPRRPSEPHAAGRCLKLSYLLLCTTCRH